MTKSQTDNTEWLDELRKIIDHTNIKVCHLAGCAHKIYCIYETVELIQAKLEQQDIKSRIDEQMIVRECAYGNPVSGFMSLDVKAMDKRLTKLRSLL